VNIDLCGLLNSGGADISVAGSGYVTHHGLGDVNTAGGNFTGYAGTGDYTLKNNAIIETAGGLITISAGGDIILGSSGTDNLTIYRWSYVDEITRGYDFREFGYYYLDGTNIIRVPLAIGNDIGRDETLTDGAFLIYDDNLFGFYTTFDRGSSGYYHPTDKSGEDNWTYYTEPTHNEDGMDHLEYAFPIKDTTQYRWEDIWGLGDEDFNDAIINLSHKSYTFPPDTPDPVLDYLIPTYFRAYYEILDPHRVVMYFPFKPTEYFAYHPLTATDSSAFDEIALDVGFYDFIAGRINLRQPLAPYFGEEEEEK
jgi:hypothetical protein